MSRISRHLMLVRRWEQIAALHEGGLTFVEIDDRLGWEPAAGRRSGSWARPKSQHLAEKARLHRIALQAQKCMLCREAWIDRAAALIRANAVPRLRIRRPLALPEAAR